MTEVLKYLFENMLFEGKVFPIYEYVINTFAKNINYMKNKHTLGYSLDKIKELEANNLRLVELRAREELNICHVEEFSKLQIDISMIYDLIRTIIKTNNIGLLKHLHNTNRLSVVTIYWRGMLYRASEFGSLEILKYLVKNINAEIAVYVIQRLLRYACENGHLETVKFLVEIFKLTTKDEMEINMIYKRVCFKGHVEVLKYLERVFEFVPNNSDIAEILQHAFDDGDMNLWEYLLRTKYQQILTTLNKVL